jgi:phosphatidylglycerophosphatase A
MKTYLTPSPHDLEIIRKLDFKNPATWIATWFGVGFLRPAPGTWGSLAALPFGIFLIQTDNIFIFFLAIILFFCLGLLACNAFERMTGTHDHKMIVIDEVAGQWLTLTPLILLKDINAGSEFIIAAFLLFRFFDIVKPWPASYVDRNIKGAWGVMGDDIVAGIFAAVTLSGVMIYAGSG